MAPLSCRVLGHYWRFRVEGAAVVWDCDRCGVPGGRHERDSAAEARRMAQLLERGAPRPPTGLLAAMGGAVVTRR